MRLKARPIDFESGGKPIVIMNREDVESFALHPLDRIKMSYKGKDLIAIVDITNKFALKGEMITNDEINSFFSLQGGEEIVISHVAEPQSVLFIKQKLSGIRLDYPKIHEIVKDVVDRKLSELEISAFLSALYIRGMSMDEVEHLSRSMVDTGKKFKIEGKTIVDKHSVGGIPGDKTSLLLVPIIAAAGLTIPKTSSRAITSPAGTADRMEILAPVNLSSEDIKRVVKKTNGCLVWGGALDLAPADDKFIQVEYPLGIDPLLLPSIMSKKKAVGAQYVVIDLPTGRGAKVKTIGDAHALAADFIELGKRLDINVSCAVTFGEQPLGYSIGPALEAKEALQALMGKGPKDLIEKTVSIAGILFEMVGRANGREYALSILNSGKAEKKFREIIEEQGGNPKIRPDDIKIGEKKADINSESDGRILWIKNPEIAAIAREAGAPKDKGAGIELVLKTEDPVRKGQRLFTIYADNSIDLNNALALAKELQPIVIGKKLEEKMLLDKLPSKTPHKKLFILER